MSKKSTSKASSKEGVQMYALPGKTIHLAVTKGTDGDKNKGVPKRAPGMRQIEPKTMFVCSEAESKSLIGQGAAMLAKDMPKSQTAQEKTDAAAEAAAEAAADKVAADKEAADKVAADKEAAATAAAAAAGTGLPVVK